MTVSCLFLAFTSVSVTVQAIQDEQPELVALPQLDELSELDESSELGDATGDVAPESLLAKPKPKPELVKRKTYVIKSQVQASQEQPNVIYITPWQELNAPIEIDPINESVVLPNFQPINPRKFRKNVKDFYQQNDQ